MTEAQFKEHLDAAERNPKEIAAAVSGLSESILRYKPSNCFEVPPCFYTVAGDTVRALGIEHPYCPNC